MVRAFRIRYFKETVTESMGRMFGPEPVVSRFMVSLPEEMFSSSSGLSVAGNRAIFSPRRSTNCSFILEMSVGSCESTEYRRTTSPSRIRVACVAASRNEQFLVPVPWMSKQVNLFTGMRECSSGPSRNNQSFDGRVRNTLVSATSELCAFGGTS